MKLNEEKLYDYLVEVNNTIVFLLEENKRHTKVLGALCDVVMNQVKFNDIVKFGFEDIRKKEAAR